MSAMQGVRIHMIDVSQSSVGISHRYRRMPSPMLLCAVLSYKRNNMPPIKHNDCDDNEYEL